MVSEPFSGRPVIRENGLNDGVKGAGMVHFPAMRQFMDNHIVQHVLRGKDEPPVEIQISFPAAASPPGLLLPDGDPPIGDLQDPGIIFHFADENIPGCLQISGTVFF